MCMRGTVGNESGLGLTLRRRRRWVVSLYDKQYPPQGRKEKSRRRRKLKVCTDVSGLALGSRMLILLVVVGTEGMEKNTASTM